LGSRSGGHEVSVAKTPGFPLGTVPAVDVTVRLRVSVSGNDICPPLVEIDTLNYKDY
jgi:hypothetical protein